MKFKDRWDIDIITGSEDLDWWDIDIITGSEELGSWDIDIITGSKGLGRWDIDIITGSENFKGSFETLKGSLAIFCFNDSRPSHDKPTKLSMM